MWNKFKSLPLTVKMAGVFLTLLISAGVVTIPYVVIPILVAMLGIVSGIRIAVYLADGK
jgi:hypothetical protein